MPTKSRLLLRIRKYGNIHRRLSVVRRRLLGVPSGESEGISSAEIPSSSWDIWIYYPGLRELFELLSIAATSSISISENININCLPPPAVLSSISISPPQQYINIRIPRTAICQYQNPRTAICQYQNPRTAICQYQNRENSSISISEWPEQQYVSIRMARTAICQYQNRRHSNINIIIAATAVFQYQNRSAAVSVSIERQPKYNQQQYQYQLNAGQSIISSSINIRMNRRRRISQQDQLIDGPKYLSESPSPAVSRI
jgi:hypothetical protein